MNEPKTDNQWHSEQARAERKARLNSLKDKNGGKKPLKTGNPLFKIILAIVLIGAILVTSGWFALNSGLPQQTLSAMSVNGKAVKVAELNYYFYMTASNYGIDMTDPATADVTLSMPSTVEGFDTYKDMLVDSAAQMVQENVMLADEASKAGLALDDSDQQKITDFYETLQQQADASQMTMTNFMAQYFGKGATTESLRPAFERLLLAQKYAAQKQESFEFSDAELKAYYDEHRDEYDKVSYRAFTFAADVAEDASDADKEKAAAEAKAKAEAMATLVTDEASFKAQAIANAAQDQKDSYTNDDASLMADTRYYSISSLSQSAWLFDEARKAGDMTVVDDSDAASSTVLYFINRSIDDQPRVDVRHILIMADETTATEEEIAAAKAKADDILAQYRAGEQTEDAFAELAKVNSEDGNAADGGIYTDIYPGQMVDTFNNWIFDPARKTGDTEVVQTNYGFHVMYFVRPAGVEWEINVRSVLADEAYRAYLTELKTAYPYELNDLGLRFVP
ncbi:MAG: peptidylprolyl isomerase [Eubacteriales bacterium]|nr:peptidylprolyl isomerase [Eubacteriales bacterium]